MKKKSMTPVNPPEPDVQSQDEKFLKKLRAAIEDILSDSEPAFSIDALRRKLLIGRTGFFKKVKAATGQTPNEYIMSYRLERAAQLLKKNYGKVIDVAVALGFSSPQYFATCFNEKFGQSPTEFLRSDTDEPPPDSSTKALDQAIIANLPQKLIGKDGEGTPQREEIFKQVMQRYDVYSVVNEALEHITELEFVKKIRKMIQEKKMNIKKLGGYALKYLDFYGIKEEFVRRNAHFTAAVCMAEDILSSNNGTSGLRVKNYGETFNLHENEPFREQPIAAGRMGTGVLVGDDMILTAAHLANEKNVSDLRFVFDFVMLNPIKPVKEIPKGNIYSGVEILHRIHNPDGDWALVKLDRKVADREVAALSQKGIFDGQPVYVLGYPCGLPLKLVQGTKIGGITNSYFKSDLDVYCGSGGSPVFCAETHELIGIVSRANVGDFMWTGNGWLSLPYPRMDIITEGSRCTRVSELSKYVVK